MKLITNANLVFFNEVFFGKAFNVITVQLLFYSDFSGKIFTNKTKTANFNGLFGLSIF